ncbi:MAG: 50S ribosomal protein L6 [Candidatus Bathyarchaeia archaeon]
MSRIGKKPIPLPKGIEVKLDNNQIIMKGPKGSLTHTIPQGIKVSVEKDKIVLSKESEEAKVSALYGTTRALLNNMVIGLTQGFKKELQIEGIGYRGEVKGSKLVLTVGYSHPVEYPIPSDIKIEVDAKQNIIRVSGIDKQKVGQVAAEIRACRKPDSYKGKGIRYLGEQIRLKEGKTA